MVTRHRGEGLRYRFYLHGLASGCTEYARVAVLRYQQRPMRVEKLAVAVPVEMYSTFVEEVHAQSIAYYRTHEEYVHRTRSLQTWLRQYATENGHLAECV